MTLAVRDALEGHHPSPISPRDVRRRGTCRRLNSASGIPHSVQHHLHDRESPRSQHQTHTSLPSERTRHSRHDPQGQDDSEAENPAQKFQGPQGLQRQIDRHSSGPAPRTRGASAVFAIAEPDRGTSIDGSGSQRSSRRPQRRATQGADRGYREQRPPSVAAIHYIPFRSSRRGLCKAWTAPAPLLPAGLATSRDERQPSPARIRLRGPGRSGEAWTGRLTRRDVELGVLEVRECVAGRAGKWGACGRGAGCGGVVADGAWMLWLRDRMRRGGDFGVGRDGLCSSVVGDDFG